MSVPVNCFSLQVLYVPDQDEMEKAMPKPIPPSHPSPPLPPSSSEATSVPSSNHLKSAPASVSHLSPEHHVGSQDTLRSASVSNAISSDRIPDNEVSEDGRGVCDDKEGVAGGKLEVFSPPSSPPSIVDCARDFEEEVTDSHIMIMSKYMSEDQVGQDVM